jgi:1-acyl-sn-glycerol-3-phosphate acyltransferase
MSAKPSAKYRFFERYKSVTDRYGFNVTSYKGIERFVNLLFQYWFTVKIARIENIPAEGKAVLFGNHSGGLPVDGALLYDGMVNYHPAPRRVRYLVTKFLLNAPMVGKMLRGFGCVPPKYETAIELLEGQDLVFFYPEAEKGTGKLFKNRYKLVDFHGGFVRAALQTQSPLVPIVTIGSEELYPMFANIKWVAKLLGWPYYPITPQFPMLPFPFYTIPLPSRILICAWPAFTLKYPPEAADDEALVAEIAEDMRKEVQVKVNGLLALRKSPFLPWDMKAVHDYLHGDGATFAVDSKHTD